MNFSKHQPAFKFLKMPNERRQNRRRPNERTPYSRRTASNSDRDQPEETNRPQRQGGLINPGFSIATRIRDQIRDGLEHHLRNLHSTADASAPFRITLDLSNNLPMDSTTGREQRLRNMASNQDDIPARRTRASISQEGQIQRPQLPRHRRQIPRPNIPIRDATATNIVNEATLMEHLSQISQIFRNAPPTLPHRMQQQRLPNDNQQNPVQFMTLNLVPDSDESDHIHSFQRQRRRQPAPPRRSRRLNNLPPEDPSEQHEEPVEEESDSDSVQFISHRFPNSFRSTDQQQPIQQIRRLFRDNQDGTRDVGGFVVTRTYNLNEMDRIPDEEGTRSIFPGFDAFFDPFESFTYDDWLNFQETLGNARPRDAGVKEDVFDKLRTVLVGKAATIVTDKCACVICMTDYENGENAILLNCKHHYHNGCIKKWFEAHSTCPVCRFQVK